MRLEIKFDATIFLIATIILVGFVLLGVDLQSDMALIFLWALAILNNVSKVHVIEPTNND